MVIDLKTYNDNINWWMFYSNDKILKDKETYYISLYKDILKQEGEINIYVHFPFCDSLCVYCPFIKDIIQNNDKREHILKDYIDKVCLSIEEKANILKGLWLEKDFYKIKTISFWWWTPSVIPNFLLIKVIETLQKYFGNFDYLEEFTIEINPNEDNYKNVYPLKKYGVNRLSLWIQTFDKKITKITWRELKNKNAIEIIQEVKNNFSKYNIDLMYNLPYFTDDILEEDLKIIAQLMPPHISYYPLYVFPKTPLYTIQLKEAIPSFDTTKKWYDYNKIIQDFWKIKKALWEYYNFYTMDYLSINQDNEHIYQKNFLNNKVLLGFWPRSYNSSEHTFSLNWLDFLNILDNTYYLYNPLYKEVKNIFQSIRFNKKIYNKEMLLSLLEWKDTTKLSEELDFLEKEYFTKKRQDLQYYLSSIFLSIFKELWL